MVGGRYYKPRQPYLAYVDMGHQLQARPTTASSVGLPVWCGSSSTLLSRRFHQHWRKDGKVVGNQLPQHEDVLIRRVMITFVNGSQPKFGEKSTVDAFSSRKVREKVVVACFGFIWQLLYNHGVISLKRFVSSFTTKLCNQLYFLIIFNTPCMYGKIRCEVS